MMRPASAVFAIVLVSFSAFARDDSSTASDAIFDLRDWGYSRERKTLTGSNRVTGTLSVKNTSKSIANDVTLTLTLATGLGEQVVDPIVHKAGVFKPGEKRTVKFVAEFVPVFNSYTVDIHFNGSRKEQWHGNSDTAQPESKNAPARGQPLVLILGKEAALDKYGTFAGTVHVKNEGTEPAKNMKLVVTFFDLKKNKVKEWSAPLGAGTLDASTEQKIPFTMQAAPKNYGSYTLKVNHDDAQPEMSLAGGEFTNVEDVEFAHFKFTRLEGKNAPMKIDAQCRNGFKHAVEHVKLEMIFYGAKKREVKRFTHEVPGAFAAGEIKPVSFEIAGFPAYEEYEQRVTYAKLGAGPSKAVQSASKLKFENKPDVEVVFGAMTLNADNVIEIAGAVRNGKTLPVKNVEIHVTLLKRDGSALTNVTRNLPSVLKPGEEKEVIVYVEKSRFGRQLHFRIQIPTRL